jgi:dihydrofolate reductase
MSPWILTFTSGTAIIIHRRVVKEAAMRKVVLGVGISLDGYIARPDGSVDFLFMPKDYSMAEFLKQVDTAVMGRKTYEVGLKMGGGFEQGGMKNFVFSRSIESGERGGVTIVAEPPKPFVEALRQGKGKDIWLMGGGELTREFLREDLVDEMYLGVVPVLIGEGIAAFPTGFPERQFVLVDNKTYSKGLIALRYERRSGKKKKA